MKWEGWYKMNSEKVMLWVGAGQIGMAIARRIGYGMKIIVGDKNLENAQNVAKIMNNAGFDVIPVEMDLSSKESICLVNSAEGRTVVRGYELCAHAPVVYFRSLKLKAHNKILVQIAGSRYFSVGEASLVQHFPRFLGKVGKVAAVKTYAVVFKLYSRLAHFREHLYGVGNAGAQSVIGIHKEGAGVGEGLGVMPEGFQF